MAADSVPETPTPAVRRRKPAGEPVDDASPEKSLSEKTEIEDEDRYSPWLDVFRVLTFLVVASCGLSYVTSGGETFFWYYGHEAKPSWMSLDHWKAKFDGPLLLTIDELAAYDGTDASKPIYLAINGTIYDVSAGSRIYGPGGSYQFFAGCDASRAYVTGCFAEDRTGDMRGVEEMYLPLDDPEVDSHWTREEMNELRRKERREAKEKVHDALKHWVDFFANSPKYPEVGRVNRKRDWYKGTPRLKLCEAAAKGRQKRKIPEKA